MIGVRHDGRVPWGTCLGCRDDTCLLERDRLPPTIALDPYAGKTERPAAVFAVPRGLTHKLTDLDSDLAVDVHLYVADFLRVDFDHAALEAVQQFSLVAEPPGGVGEDIIVRVGVGQSDEIGFDHCVCKYSVGFLDRRRGVREP